MTVRFLVELEVPLSNQIQLVMKNIHNLRKNLKDEDCPAMRT